MSSVFLTAEWRHLAMLNFPIEPKTLQKLSPKGTEIDDWKGTTYVSLVAFLFLETKVKGLAVPFHRDFEEINLRFYVRSRGPKGWRRGVVFVREVVPKQAIAFLARMLYNENYIACPTHSSVTYPSGGTEGKVEYGWRPDGQWLSIGAKFSGEPNLPKKNSLEEFITEHYWGYSSQRDGGTVEYQVEHPQWKLWDATQVNLEGDIAAFYPPEFSSALNSSPSSAFVAKGSEVKVYSGTRLKD